MISCFHSSQQAHSPLSHFWVAQFTPFFSSRIIFLTFPAAGHSHAHESRTLLFQRTTVLHVPCSVSGGLKPPGDPWQEGPCDFPCIIGSSTLSTILSILLLKTAAALCKLYIISIGLIIRFFFSRSSYPSVFFFAFSGVFEFIVLGTWLCLPPPDTWGTSIFLVPPGFFFWNNPRWPSNCPSMNMFFKLADRTVAEKGAVLS